MFKFFKHIYYKIKIAMKDYSQGQEQQIIANYFGDLKGTVLDIGANDGKTFSNSLALIENGWEAVLLEPAQMAFNKLERLHETNDKVRCYKIAIGNEIGKVKLKVSGAHLPDGSDVALLSSLKEEETTRWRDAGVKFHEEEIIVSTFSHFKKLSGNTAFDFITIDCEGLDVDVLKQIDLSETKLICIEWNSKPEAKAAILEYCAKFEMTKIIYESGENLLICRQ